jgi:hypothetical protein
MVEVMSDPGVEVYPAGRIVEDLSEAGNNADGSDIAQTAQGKALSQSSYRSGSVTSVATKETGGTGSNASQGDRLTEAEFLTELRRWCRIPDQTSLDANSAMTSTSEGSAAPSLRRSSRLLNQQK